MRVDLSPSGSLCVDRLIVCRIEGESVRETSLPFAIFVRDGELERYLLVPHRLRGDLPERGGLTCRGVGSAYSEPVHGDSRLFERVLWFLLRGIAAFGLMVTALRRHLSIRVFRALGRFARLTSIPIPNELGHRLGDGHRWSGSQHGSRTRQKGGQAMGPWGVVCHLQLKSWRLPVTCLCVCNFLGEFSAPASLGERSPQRARHARCFQACCLSMRSAVSGWMLRQFDSVHRFYFSCTYMAGTG